MPIRRFEEIESWQDATELTQGIFALSNHKSPKQRHGALWEQWEGELGRPEDIVEITDST